MEAVRLTNKKIIGYLWCKVDTDNDFISMFPHTDNLGLFPLQTSYLNDKSEQEQYNEAYQIFKTVISFRHFSALKDFKHPPKFNLKDYLPFENLMNDVKALNKLSFTELDAEQRLKVWIFNRIWGAMNYTANVIVKSYNEQPKECKIEDFVKPLISGNIEYEYEAEDFFKRQINKEPDYITKNLIKSLNAKVDAIILKEKIKLEVNHLEPNILSENTKKITNDIIDNLSFYEEWYNANMPPISETLILCQWEKNDDYNYLIENLLLISKLNKLKEELLYPKRLIEVQINKRKIKEEAKKTQLNKEIEEWVSKCFGNRIKIDEITTLISNTQFIFTQNKLPSSIEPIVVKNLKPYDINYFIWHIWNMHKEISYLNGNIKQPLIAQYVKKQFPYIYKDIDDERTIVKHLKEGGSYINESLNTE